jgi:hypothetical protein
MARHQNLRTLAQRLQLCAVAGTFTLVACPLDTFFFKLVCVFVEQWVEDHIETEDRLKVGRSVLERAARRYQHTGFARLDAVSSATSSVSDRMIDRAPSRTAQYEADDMALEVVPSASLSLRNDDKPDVQSFLASVRERREQQKARRK